MAQMSKSQQATWARQQEAALALAKAQFEQYPTRLMAALERATTLNFELEVRNSQFNLRDRDDSYSQLFVLTFTHDQDSQNALESLEYDLKDKAAAEAEATRKYELKKAALAKLTPEEKELLNLE
ncbi:hypothetical protein UFOVP1636_58 [uncultured Caudovirales phage]|uniref:Uncharacterized protein n=1 Tax=uncultured Caudovirales phage TaxID=2100421 RepID=A0A6J5T2D8_9CAUD|nr:hypothetical protein UFOVP1636_58 [uncultured Caudovirales phage]